MTRHDALARRLKALARDAQRDPARYPEERLRALEEAAQGFRDHDDDAVERALARADALGTEARPIDDAAFPRRRP